MKVKRLRVENFKKFKILEVEFQDFDFLVGTNNCGKSSILQALSIFQFCLDKTLAKRKNPDGSMKTVFDVKKEKIKESGEKKITGKGLGRDEFTVIPVSDPLDLWTDRITLKEGKPVNMKFEVLFDNGTEVSFGIGLPYNRFSIRPTCNREDVEEVGNVSIVFVPSFAGLLVKEPFLTAAWRKTLIAEGRHGETIRNTLFDLKERYPDKFNRLTDILSKNFAVELTNIKFDSLKDLYISSEYDEHRKNNLDISLSGSGFHQFLQIFAFILLQKPTTVLLDEPDAHLHASLQKILLSVIKSISKTEKVQIIISTHSKELINRVSPTSILYFYKDGLPKRLEKRFEILEVFQDLGDIDNIDLAKLKDCKKVIFVEGKTDIDFVETFANKYEDSDLVKMIREKTIFIRMGGGSKSIDDMINVLQQFVESENRINAFVLKDREFMLDKDYSRYEENMNKEGQTFHIWRKNEIENFLLVPALIRRTMETKYQGEADSLLMPNIEQIKEKIFECCRSLKDRIVLDGLSKEYKNKNKEWDIPTCNDSSRNYLSNNWTDNSMLSFCPGKEILKHLRSQFRDFHFTNEDILFELKKDELDSDVINFLNKLKQFLMS